MLLWRNGIYSFNNERLADIVNKLELYYDVTINIANPKLKDINYTCKFRQRDGIEKILHTIQNDVSFEWYVVFSLFHLFDGIYMYNLYLSIWDLQY